LSSTYRDLVEYRTEILKELDRVFEGVGMEKFIPSGTPSQEVYINNLRKSNIVIFLISPYYGSLMETCSFREECKAECPLKKGEGQISYTHCEYNITKAENIPHQTYLIQKEWDAVDYLKEMDKKDIDFFLKNLNRLKENKVFEAMSDERIKHYLKIYNQSWKFKQELGNEEFYFVINDIETPDFVNIVKKHLAENISNWYFNKTLRFTNFCNRRNELMELLENIDNKIEVYGVGGVGKTALIQVALLIQKLRGKDAIAVGLEQSYASGSGYEYFRKKCSELHHRVRGNKINLYDILDALSKFSLDIKEIRKKERDLIIDYISNFIELKNFILFIDDFHLANEDVHKLVKKVNNVIFSSRRNTGLAKKEIHVIGIDEKEREDLVNLMCELSDIKLPNNIKKTIQHLTEGHPMSTKLLVKNYHKINFDKFKDFNLKDANSEQVEEFYNRVVKDILSNKAFILLKNLAVINTDLDTNIERDCVEQSYNIQNIAEIFNELIDSEMLKKKEGKEGIYEFSFKHVKDALKFITDQDSHQKAIEYYNKKNEILGHNYQDVIEILFHKSKSNPTKELLIEFVKIGSKEFPVHYNFKRLIDIGEDLKNLFKGKDKASIQNTMGIIYTNIGHYDQATSLLEQALKIRCKILGEEHLDVAESLNNLATLHYWKGNYKETESLCRKALKIRRKLLGKEHSDISTSLNDLAMALKAQDKYLECEPMYREALAMNQKLLGEDHPRVAQSLNNLGMLLYNKKEYIEAERLFREALIKNHKLFGDEHPEISANLNNLSLVLLEKGDYIAAEPMLRQALAMDRKYLGENHPYVGKTLNNLAKLLTRKGNYAEAEQTFREALKVKRKTFPEDHWEIADTKSLYGYCLSKSCKFSEAEEALVDSYLIIKEEFGDQYSRTLLALKRIIELYEAWDKNKKAEKYRKLLEKKGSKSN